LGKERSDLARQEELLGRLKMPSSRAEYYRLQARLCVRLSLASSQDNDISERLIAMAQRFKARAEAIEREHHVYDSGPELVH
jgi:hypothetical protein